MTQPATSAPFRTADFEAAIDAVIDAVGKTLVLGIPLGLGKPNGFANALYARAKADTTIDLTIFTALTLKKPKAPGVGGAFLNPVIERTMGGYEDLQYLLDRNRQALPANIRVVEFFYQAGTQLGNVTAQQNYISSNYTHVARDMIDKGANVFAQMVSEREGPNGAEISLACNPDVTLEVVPMARARYPIVTVGEISTELPHMLGDCIQQPEDFDVLIEPTQKPDHLFAVPKLPVGLTEHAIGLYASTLVKDGGTIQLGIGALGDSVSHALTLRHHHNSAWQSLTEQLPNRDNDGAAALADIGGTDRFEQGLYGATEMFVDGFLALYTAGILKRQVYDDLAVQQAVNAGEDAPADANGYVLHGGFFLGPRCFYDALRDMPAEQKALFNMTSVKRINQLYSTEDLDRAQRTEARFINTGLKCTLSGAVVSDGLANHKVLSGVGGQYNFVAQAHALDDGRSILLIKAVRGEGDDAESNIVWDYPHTTIARHLRDIVITEYGIANLRGATDRDIIARLLNVADSRFQADLLARAKAAGKIEADYEIPPQHRNNTPEALDAVLQPARDAGHLPHFPLPCDWTEQEQRLTLALGALKDLQASKGKLGLMIAGWKAGEPQADQMDDLARVGLAEPEGLQETVTARLLGAALREI